MLYNFVNLSSTLKEESEIELKTTVPVKTALHEALFKPWRQLSAATWLSFFRSSKLSSSWETVEVFMAKDFVTSMGDSPDLDPTKALQRPASGSAHLEEKVPQGCPTNGGIVYRWRQNGYLVEIL